MTVKGRLRTLTLLSVSRQSRFYDGTDFGVTPPVQRGAKLASSSSSYGENVPRYIVRRAILSGWWMATARQWETS